MKYVLHNNNKSGGFTNNTRVRITHITKYRIVVQTIGEYPRRLSLPRIRFKVKLPYGHGFEMIRLQFPLRRAFAMTAHKSQSQTVEKAVLDIRDPIFAHGQLYTGASRVRNPDDLAWVVDADTLCHMPDNVVDDARTHQLYHIEGAEYDNDEVRNNDDIDVDDDDESDDDIENDDYDISMGNLDEEEQNEKFDYRPYIGSVYVDNIVYQEAIDQCLPPLEP